MIYNISPENKISLFTAALWFHQMWRSTNLTQIQGDKGPENVDTTEAVSSLKWEAGPNRANIFCSCTFLPSLIKDMPWVAEMILCVPNCWMPIEILLFKGVALLKLPFKLLLEIRRLLVPGLDPRTFSCSTTTWLCTFFFSCEEGQSEIRYKYNGSCGMRQSVFNEVTILIKLD